MAIIQGEGLEFNEVPKQSWNGGNHPGRLRIQSFRPMHSEPLTDAMIGQGMMSIGGGGYGGGGLPYPRRCCNCGAERSRAIPSPHPRAARGPRRRLGQAKLRDDRDRPQGQRTPKSPAVVAGGYATLQFEGPAGADAFLVLRDDRVVAGPLRIEGSQKQWTDKANAAEHR